MVKAHGNRFGYNTAELRRRFAAGDHTALLPALFIYFITNKPVPEWVRNGFVKAFLAGDGGQAGSWDKVFGRPRTRAQFQRMFRHLDAAHTIWDLVADAKAQGKPIDDDLFSNIGHRLGVGSKTLTKELYREIVYLRGRP